MTHQYTMLYICYIIYFYQFDKILLYLSSGKKGSFDQFSKKYKIEESCSQEKKKMLLTATKICFSSV